VTEGERYQVQARALGDPTRHQVFRIVAEADGPVGVAELVERFGLNHNAIRQHLAKLVAAGLLVEARAAPRGRGRPRLEYRLAPAVAGQWGVPGPYERLSLLLAELVGSGEAPVELGRRAGARHGGAGATDPVAALHEEMAAQGFAPEVSRVGDQVELALRRCPFASVAEAAPSTVCALHLGLAEGLAEAVGGLVVDGLDVADPRLGLCRLRAHLT
jgi:predicted ArsR family transcriptional regulator